MHAVQQTSDDHPPDALGRERSISNRRSMATEAA